MNTKGKPERKVKSPLPNVTATTPTVTVVVAVPPSPMVVISVTSHMTAKTLQR